MKDKREMGIEMEMVFYIIQMDFVMKVSLNKGIDMDMVF